MAHQGQAMLDIIARTPFSIEEVASLVEVTRRTIYLWGKKEKLDGYVIDRVGNAIGIDMRATMPQVFGVDQPISLRSTRKNNPNSTVVEYWKGKYAEALDEAKSSKEKLAEANNEIKQLKAALWDAEKESKKKNTK